MEGGQLEISRSKGEELIHLEEEGSGEKDALEDARRAEAEVAFRLEEGDGEVKDGLSCGEGVDNPGTFLQVQERRSDEKQIVDLLESESALS